MIGSTVSNGGIGRRLLNVRETAQYLGPEVDTVYKKARLRELSCVTVGRALRFDSETLGRFFEPRAQRASISPSGTAVMHLADRDWLINHWTRLGMQPILIYRHEQLFIRIAEHEPAFVSSFESPSS